MLLEPHASLQLHSGAQLRVHPLTITLLRKQQLLSAALKKSCSSNEILVCLFHPVVSPVRPRGVQTPWTECQTQINRINCVCEEKVWKKKLRYKELFDFICKLKYINCRLNYISLKCLKCSYFISSGFQWGASVRLTADSGTELRDDEGSNSVAFTYCSK